VVVKEPVCCFTLCPNLCFLNAEIFNSKVKLLVKIASTVKEKGCIEATQRLATARRRRMKSCSTSIPWMRRRLRCERGIECGEQQQDRLPHSALP
jgi:hypothetical protein